MPRTNFPSQGPIRYAVVGLGHIAQVAVLPAFKNAGKNSQLVAIVSGDQKKLREMREEHNVPVAVTYDALPALYESGQIDAVYIALPNSLHARATIDAARAGLHVLCEKPMAVREEECEDMIRACREHGVRLMIAYRLHFEAATLRAVELVRSGKIGEPRVFTSLFTMNVKDKKNIRLRGEEGNGPLWDIGIYCINAARSVFRAEPVEVLGFGAAKPNDARFREVDETFSAILRYPGERVGSFTCSFGCNDSSRYTVVGTEGSVTLDPAFEYAEGLGLELTIGDKKPKKREYAKRDQFAAEIMYFSHCLLTGEHPEPSGVEGLNDVAIMRALLRSAREGRAVRVDLPRDRHPHAGQRIDRPGHSGGREVGVVSPRGE
ncbi:MAG TPA: Gfo/Idh/MocA family oxidoreductase [Phycisphaerales bacterium]|nr:Gfo/Idh/MocA family oxidoreductase [Phycisphaerales bacterium]